MSQLRADCNTPPCTALTCVCRASERIECPLSKRKQAWIGCQKWACSIVCASYPPSSGNFTAMGYLAAHYYSQLFHYQATRTHWWASVRFLVKPRSTLRRRATSLSCRSRPQSPGRRSRLSDWRAQLGEKGIMHSLSAGRSKPQGWQSRQWREGNQTPMSCLWLCIFYAARWQRWLYRVWSDSLWRLQWLSGK